jgi:hypothetical protein
VLPRDRHTVYTLEMVSDPVAHLSSYRPLLKCHRCNPGHASNQPLLFKVTSPELIVQEIINEEIPFSEILSEPPLIMTVAQNKCTLTVPKPRLLAASLRDYARNSTPLLKVCSSENELLQRRLRL